MALQKVIPAGALICGLTLLGLGVPSFMAGLHLDPHGQTLKNIADGKNFSPALLERTIESRKAAMSWGMRAQSYSDLGVLYLAKAGLKKNSAQARAALIRQSIEVQRNALARAPGDAYGWTRLAQGLVRHNDASKSPEAVLRFSLALAPYERALILPRIDMALLRWRRLPPALKKQFQDQLRLAAKWAPTGLARVARARFSLNLVMDALRTRPRLMQRFIYAYSRS